MSRWTVLVIRTRTSILPRRRGRPRKPPLSVAPNSNRSSFDSLIPSYFELRIVRVDVEKLREHRNERCSRISSLDTDVHRQSEIFVISKNRDETRNVFFHGLSRHKFLLFPSMTNNRNILFPGLSKIHTKVLRNLEYFHRKFTR